MQHSVICSKHFKERYLKVTKTNYFVMGCIEPVTSVYSEIELKPPLVSKLEKVGSMAELVKRRFNDNTDHVMWVQLARWSRCCALG